jgi:anaerobic ribonucleoside-triphosphate reductase activating protein
MYYSEINKCSTVDGPGVRVAVFFSGCHANKCKEGHCPGCHNPAAWNFSLGSEYTKGTEDEIVAAVSKPYISGLSILGGEPYDSDAHLLVSLVERVKQQYPDKDVWIWTGYEFDHIISSPLTKLVDVAVCGRFILDQRDISSKNIFRGSANQRVIDVQASLNSGRTIGLSGIPNNEV